MHYQKYLLEELGRRQEKNPSYSLRSFARSLGFSPTLLSHLLSGKRPLTFRSANILAQRLGLPPQELTKLQSQLPTKRRPKLPVPQKRSLALDEFKRIADWEHYAVLALSRVPNCRADHRWIARRLGISSTRAREVFQRLVRLGLVENQGMGFRQISPPLTTSQDIPSSAIKKYHRQNLEKATHSLFSDPVEDRYFGSVTLALDPAELPRLKKFLRKSREQLDSLAAKGKRSRVYHFSVQLFPIDKGDKK